MTPSRPSWSDIAAIVTLVLAASILALPILRGGFLTYMDNPAHLAELSELSKSNSGWTDIAFTGFPIGTLHSPLWYPTLAWLGRLVGSHEGVYVGALFLSFCAPPLALFAVARRHLSTTAATLLAYLLMIQAPNLRGVGSPLAGMWTHALGAAGVIGLAELSSRERLKPSATLTMAALLGAIGLTHFFALLAAALVVILTSARVRNDPTERSKRVVATGAAAIASAAYWLPYFTSTSPEHAPTDVLDPKALLIRLFLPSNTLYLLDERYTDAIQWENHLTDAVPMVGLFVLGLSGIAVRDGRSVPLARTGRWLALAFTLAVFAHAAHPLSFLGPVPWRHLDWIRIGLCLSALPVLERVPAVGRVTRGAAFAIAVALAPWWARPLALDHPSATDAEWASLRRTWRWIREHYDESWGRLYMLDTFGGNWRQGGLNHSHVLALTHRETGVPQLGSYYGVVPFRTRWTLSEFNRLYSLRNLPPEGLAIMMDKTNAQSVLASNDNAAKWFEETGGFEKLFSDGRFSVWRREDAKSEWIAPLRPSNHVESVSIGDGRIDFVLDAEQRRASVVAKVSWHPYWRLRGPKSATLVETPDGFLGIKGLPKGRTRLSLRYIPDPWPRRISALGWTLLAGWGIGLFARRRRRAAAET